MSQIDVETESAGNAAKGRQRKCCLRGPGEDAMRRSAAICALLVVAGCDRSVYSSWSTEKPAERADIADVNARNALSRIRSLEDTLSDQASKIESLETELSSAKSEAEAAQATAEAAERRIEEVVDHYNNHLLNPRSGY